MNIQRTHFLQCFLLLLPVKHRPTPLRLLPFCSGLLFLHTLTIHCTAATNVVSSSTYFTPDNVTHILHVSVRATYCLFHQPSDDAQQNQKYEQCIISRPDTKMNTSSQVSFFYLEDISEGTEQRGSLHKGVNIEQNYQIRCYISSWRLFLSLERVTSHSVRAPFCIQQY